MEVEQKKFQGISPIARKISVAFTFLSLVLPWASRWEMDAHLFIYGYYTSITGFRSYSAHWLWTIPLMCLVLGLILLLGGRFERRTINASLFIVGSNLILFAGYFFLLWFLPPSEYIILAAKPSLGFIFAVLGAFSAVIGALSDLIELWSV